MRGNDCNAGSADAADGVWATLSGPATAAGGFCGASGGFCSDAAAAVAGPSAAPCCAAGSGVTAAAACCWGAEAAAPPGAIRTTRVSPSLSPRADSSAAASSGSYGAQSTVNSCVCVQHALAENADDEPDNQVLHNTGIAFRNMQFVLRTPSDRVHGQHAPCRAAQPAAMLQPQHLHRTRREAGQQLLCSRGHASAVGEQGLEV